MMTIQNKIKEHAEQTVNARFPWLDQEIAVGKKLQKLQNGEQIVIEKEDVFSALSNKPLCLCCLRRFSSTRALEQHILHKHKMPLEEYSAEFPNAL